MSGVALANDVPCASNFSCLETTDAFSILKQALPPVFFKETENVFRGDTKFTETRVKLWKKEKWYFLVLANFGSVFIIV